MTTDVTIGLHGTTEKNDRRVGLRLFSPRARHNVAAHWKVGILILSSGSLSHAWAVTRVSRETFTTERHAAELTPCPRMTLLWEWSDGSP